MSQVNKKSPRFSEWEFPCGKQCPVTACCNIYCINVFNYANMIADSIYLMNDEELEIYRKTTPRLVQRKIMKLYMDESKLSFPESATISRDWK